MKRTIVATAAHAGLLLAASLFLVALGQGARALAGPIYWGTIKGTLVPGDSVQSPKVYAVQIQGQERWLRIDNANVENFDTKYVGGIRVLNEAVPTQKLRLTGDECALRLLSRPDAVDRSFRINGTLLLSRGEFRVNSAEQVGGAPLEPTPAITSAQTETDPCG